MYILISGDVDEKTATFPPRLDLLLPDGWLLGQAAVIK